MQEASVEPAKQDDLWERQQIKAFTAWCNSHLKHRDAKITNIAEDFTDGIKLIQLMEVCGNVTLPKPSKMKMKIHKVQNINHVMKFLAEKKVKLIGIGAEEITDGNRKLILGMIWTIILRFDIQDISLDQANAKDALLLWCQRKTASYNNVNINNFHTAWKDGLGFCALIHKHRPELIDYDSLRKGNALENLTLAMSVAERDLGLEPMIDPADMAAGMKPDERSVITQVAAFYKLFASYNKGEIAATKIASVLKTNKEHDRLIQEYETMASSLLEWIPGAVERLNERPVLSSTEQCLAQLAAFSSFRTEEYPAKLKEKAMLEAHYSSLQTKLRLSGRAPYMPEQGKMIEEINAAWEGLDACDVANKEWVVAEMARCRQCKQKAAAFASKADAHEAFTGQYMPVLQANDFSGANLGTINSLKHKHEAFQTDMLARETRVHEIGTLANELDDLQYVEAATINNRYAAIYDSWNTMHELSGTRTANLDEAATAAEKLENLWLEIAKLASPLNSYLDETTEHLTEQLFCDTSEEVAAEQARHAEIKAGMAGYETDFAAYSVLVDQMVALGSTENPYTFHTTDELNAKWAALQTAAAERGAELEAAVQKEAGRDALRVQWGECTSTRLGWVEGHINKTTEITGSGDVSSPGHLEDQLEKVGALETEADTYAATFNEAEDLNKQMQAAEIFSGITTSVEVLRGKWYQLQTMFQMNKSDIENQITVRDGSNISPEQMAEFKQSFDHFDKDKSGELDKMEFRGCLISLGIDIPSVAEAGDEEFERIMRVVDPSGDGKIQFGEFVAFMADERAGAETKDALVEQFSILANGGASISQQQLSELPDGLADYCMANMAQNPDGSYDYKSFAESCYGSADV